MNNCTKSLLVIFLFSFLSYGETNLKTEKWIIDESHTKIRFEIDHLVISSVEGSFGKFSGDIFFNGAKSKKAAEGFKINVNIDASSIDTNNKKRDKHLRSPDFFNVKKYPTISFVSRTLKAKGDGKFIINGDLTIHGVTKKVLLDTIYLGSVSAYDVKRVVFKGKTKIKREDFGLKWNDFIEAGPAVGSEVEINIKLEAKRASDL